MGLIRDDMLGELGATTLQVRKMKSEAAKLGVDFRTPASPIAASGYPVAPPAGYPPTPAVYQQGLVAPGYQQMTTQSPGSDTIADLQQQLSMERMKNDLRQEIDLKSRIAATESARSAPTGAGPIINNNLQGGASGGGGGGGGGDGGNGGKSIVVHMNEEKYCGPISWIIGICFLFPCVACCPCDVRSKPTTIIV